MKAGLTRREFLRRTGSIGIVSAFLSANTHAVGRVSGNRRKPNLLFIWTDEQRFDTMAAYGNDKIKAPNLDRLASESFVLKKAYVTQPVCTPSRSSVMTGQWPHQNGCLRNNIPLRRDTKCVPELVGDPEYRSAYMGKWHLGNEIFRQHGFDEWVSIEDNYIQYYSEDRDNKLRSDYHKFLAGKGYATDRPDTYSRSFAASLPIEQCKPKFLETHACDFLRRNSDRPFMLYINYLEPHMPFTGPLNDLHDPNEMELPGNYTDPPDADEPKRYHKKVESCKKKYGMDEKSTRELIARYYGLVSQVDLSVGAILDTLDELGIADNTIVVYTSDHGDMMGSHKMVEKSLMYEESARVPWLMRIPQIGRKQSVIEQPVSHIDLVPTVLDAMGRHDAATGLPGHSLIPFFKGGRREENHVFIEWNVTDPEDASTRTVVSPDGWKLCLCDKDRCQLFDLTNDPLETANLYYTGRHDEVIKRLSKKIRQWQASVNDTLKI